MPPKAVKTVRQLVYREYAKVFDVAAVLRD